MVSCPFGPSMSHQSIGPHHWKKKLYGGEQEGRMSKGMTAGEEDRWGARRRGEERREGRDTREEAILTDGLIGRARRHLTRSCPPARQ